MADAFFVTFLIFVAIARWMLLTKSQYPPGIDPGNWLAFGHAIAGEHIRSGSVVYPPVVPLLELISSSVFGPFLGTQVLAEVASIVPAIAAYLVLRSLPAGWTAAILANFLATASSTYEAMAWGGYPQLIGLGLLILALFYLDRYLRTQRWRDALIAGVGFGLTLATSDIIAAAAAISGTALFILHLALRAGPRFTMRQLALGAVLVVIPSLPFLPLYLHIVSSVLVSFHSRASNTFISVSDLSPAATTIYPDFPMFWRTAFLMAGAVPLALIAFRRSSLWLLTASLLLGTAALVLVLREFRFLYLLPPIAVLGLACWFEYFGKSQFKWMRWAGIGGSLILLLALGIQSVAGLQFLRMSLLPYYTFLSPGLVSGIEWVRDRTPPDAVVAVSPSRGDYPLGWWMEGLARRRTLYASNPTWLNFADERRRASDAAQIFDPSVPVGVDLTRARHFGVRYILVNKDWMGNGLWTTAARAANTNSVEILVDNESVLLLGLR